MKPTYVKRRRQALQQLWFQGALSLWHEHVGLVPYRGLSMNVSVPYVQLQTDIHSPNITVFESLQFSAELRFTSDIEKDVKKAFIEEVCLPIFLVSRLFPGKSCLSSYEKHQCRLWSSMFWPSYLLRYCTSTFAPPALSLFNRSFERSTAAVSLFSSSEKLQLVTRSVCPMLYQVLALVELEPIRGSIVGKPGESGLSVEQRKRLTIAVELVANPSVVFMDEPTSGDPPFHPPCLKT